MNLVGGKGGEAGGRVVRGYKDQGRWGAKRVGSIGE